MSDDLTVAVIGVAGLLVGAGIKVVYDLVAGRGVRKREDSLRFTDERRSAYAQFLATVIPATRAALYGGELSDQWRTELYGSAAYVYLLTKSDEVVKAMDDVFGAVDEIEEALLENRGGSANIAQAFRMGAAWQTFTEAARKDLGLPVVDLG